MTSQNELPAEISCQEVKSQHDAGQDLLLLDCREVQEYNTVHIEGATLIPLSEVLTRVQELEAHREQPIVVYCHLGGRSLQLVQWLRSQGFAQAQSMAGGIDQWAAEIEPGLARY